MDKHYFTLTFLSEIILNKSGNTQGNIQASDFVSGSSLLGIAAKKYESFNNPFEIFHSGKVRFSDANPLYKENRTYKTPLSFFIPKTATQKEVYNNHFVDYSKSEILDKQLKQMRSGYITQDAKNIIYLDYNYAQKSAYDTTTRKSKDSSMFGYEAIKAGSTWEFHITFYDIPQEEKDKVINTILGQHCIGKSKSAQYGKVLITKHNHKESNIENLEAKEITYLYLDSPMALFTQNMPTLTPTKENLSLEQGEIDWDKTQIKTRKFSPFNFKRQCKDSSRLILEKGSVIAIKNASQNDIHNLKQGVGAFLSEGYGEVLINPSFLEIKESFCLEEAKLTKQTPKDLQNSDETLISFLKARQQKQENLLNLGEKVDKFIQEHKDKFLEVRKSQWGEIRMLLQFHSNPQDYIKRIKSYIKRSDEKTTKEQWKNGEKVFIQTLEAENIDFLKLLSMTMPKENDGESNE